MLLGWLGYSLSFEGWCLFKDYDVTLGQLMSPFRPYNGPWPPQQISPDVIWPGGRAAAASGPGSAIPGTQETRPLQGGQCPPGYTLSPNGKRCVPPVSGTVVA